MAQPSQTTDSAGAAPATASTSEQAADTAAAPDGASQAPLAEIPVATLPDSPPPPAQEKSVGAVKLEEVVVTVTKRKENVRNIPSSIAVLQGEKLEKLGVRKLKDIFLLVPGVNMQDEIAGLQRKVSVRGVGPDTGTNQTVGSVLGDIPISDPYGSTVIVDPNPWDLGTVEILKGPQGTLFGATSLAGLIRYVPNYPKLGLWEGKAFTEYTKVNRGSNAPNTGFALNIPVGETLAFRGSGIFQKLPGVIDSNNPSRTQQDVDTGRNWSGRVMALWKPTEELTINAWYTANERRSDDINIVTFRDGSYARNDAPTASDIVNAYGLGTLDMRYAFDWFTLVSLTGYQNKSSDTDIDTSYLLQPPSTAGVSYLRTIRNVKTKGLLQELRLVSPDTGKLTWIGGIYFSTYAADIRSRLNASNETLDQLGQLTALIPVEQLSTLVSTDGISASDGGFDPLKADEQAIYGEGNYDFTEQFRLTLGSRLYRTEVGGTLLASGASAINSGQSPRILEKGFSPKIAATYRPFKDIMFYGVVARGFQFGGFNVPTIPSPDIPLTFKSSSLYNYEIGTRTDWFDRKLRFDLTVFFLDWKNPQVRQVTSDGLNGYTDNVGGSHNLGTEMTIRWKTPLRGLTLEQTASYIEARTTTTFDDASGQVVPKGTLFPSSPLVQAVSTISYSRELGNWQTQFSVINSFQGKAFAEITHETEVGDYSILGATFNLGRNDWAGAPSLTFSVNNILNVQKVAAGFGPSTGGTTSTLPSTDSTVANSSYVYSLPRSMVLRLSLEF
ncbi:MAG: TonB-dependent receptor [Pseudomonadota bacterium]